MVVNVRLWCGGIIMHEMLTAYINIYGVTQEWSMQGIHRSRRIMAVRESRLPPVRVPATTGLLPGLNEKNVHGGFATGING
jgi:hypothetical protein